MTPATETLLAAPSALEPSIQAALRRIAPLWPLDRFVAVNPFTGLAHLPFAEACHLLRRSTGAAPVQSPADYLAAFRDGTIDPDDLITAADGRWTAEQLTSMLEQTGPDEGDALIPTVADLLDRQSQHARWGGFVVEEISKWCAVVFDDNQTTWRFPWAASGLFAAWREAALHDRNPESFGLTGFRHTIARLPDESNACIDHCMTLLTRPQIDVADFLHRQLATIPGWAGYAACLDRSEEMQGGRGSVLRDLLAIRLAYDAALFDAFVKDSGLHAEWKSLHLPSGDPERCAMLACWQMAYDLGYQRTLVRQLAEQPSAQPSARPVVQAVFCIDVRSEVLRRHLETALPGTQTIGFAGFFGFPVSHQDAGSCRSTARCPVLLHPPIESRDAEDPSARWKWTGARAWKAFQNSATSCFSYVESAGLGFAAVLGRIGRKGGGVLHAPAPCLTNVSLTTRADLAEGALRNMGLTRQFARIVLICGHGSHSANNPYASSLDCGACGGHAGDVNARLAAATLNDPAVRKILVGRGIVIPDDTWFLAGLHDTLSDEVVLFDVSNAPAGHDDDLAILRDALIRAGANTRRERAASLGLTGCEPHQLDAAVRSRGQDISQVRPEWGLANNAALVAAPRSRSAALQLDGRVFLHDYDAARDPDLRILTLILTAPVVVASWINLQYYASRIDPLRYGSGDKALHHVIGGIGVIEGNGGDLKTGLPIQSVHDGGRFMHEPRRLTVIIEAPRRSIDRVLAQHDDVRQLFDNGWIHLVSLEGNHAFRRRMADWQAV